MHFSAQQVNSGIVVWIYCVTVIIMCKIQHSRWTVVLQVQCIMLHWTVCGIYSTAVRQWFCRFNLVCYSKYYLEDTVKQVDSIIVTWMEYVTANYTRYILHSWCCVILQLQRSMLEWNLFGSYCTAGGQCYFSLNAVFYNEPCVEGNAQHVVSCLKLEMFGLRWKLCWSYCIALESDSEASIQCVIVCNLLHSRLIGI